MRGESLWMLGIPAVVGWFVGCLIIARMSGWSALAKRYPAAGTAVPAQRLPLRSALMGPFARYPNCLNFAADPSGLRLSAAAFFRPGHPPLFFPWSDVSVDRTQRSFNEFVRLRFQKVPEVPLLVYSEMAGWLAAAAGASWPGDKGPSGRR